MNFWKDTFKKNLDEYLKDYFKFLEFKTIGVDPAYKADCDSCAEWLAGYLSRIGLQSEVIKTQGNSLVYGEYVPENAKHTTLIYGHYDVQPVDPLNLWESDPFKPEKREERVFARGAQDNKGQIFYCIKAVEAFIKNSKPDYAIKVIIEGEEEFGSGSLEKLLPELKSKITADQVIVMDSGTRDIKVPAVTLGMRGILNYSFRLIGANHDLHSGMHGGVAPNAAQGVAKVIASLHNSDGSIAINGYYDDVIEPTEHELSILAKTKFDLDNYKSDVGVIPVGGEVSLPPQIRLGFRPTIEINGVHSGFTGPGHKTVIPRMAECFITGRLAHGQNPERCLALLDSHIKNHIPIGYKFEIMGKGAEAPAFRVSSEEELIKTTVEVFRKQFTTEPTLSWEGASIPILASFSKHITPNILLSGFGLEEDQIHAPNESFSLEQMELGFCFIGELLEAL